MNKFVKKIMKATRWKIYWLLWDGYSLEEISDVLDESPASISLYLKGYLSSLLSKSKKKTSW